MLLKSWLFEDSLPTLNCLKKSTILNKNLKILYPQISVVFTSYQQNFYFFNKDHYSKPQPSKMQSCEVQSKKHSYNQDSENIAEERTERVQEPENSEFLVILCLLVISEVTHIKS